MFTGLVKEIGEVKSIQRKDRGRTMTIYSPILSPKLNIDDSVALDGCCQTVTSCQAPHFTIDTVQTTLDKTTLGNYSVGQKINLEPALTLADPIGGHMVTGHINKTAQVTRISKLGLANIVTIRLSPELTPFVVVEGPICLNGVSLTISRNDDPYIDVAVIPHTWEHTTLQQLRRGHLVNIEVDLFAKYTQKILSTAGKGTYL